MTPPYASDTRAKGWRFELDYEQIEQSSTWALAPAEAKPWLLMLWFTAWKQVPCGSLPADREVIAALIGIAPKVWQKHSKVLLRGWNEVGGRLYHDTLAKRVHEMMSRRRSDSDRKAAERARKAAESVVTPLGVPAESRVTPALLRPESSTGTDNLLPQEKPPSGERGKPRPAKKAPESFVLTAEMRRWAGEHTPGIDVEDEFAKFKDHTFGTSCIDWLGRFRNWLRKATEFARPNGETAYQRNARERAAEIHPAIARAAPGVTKPNPMEVLDGLTVARIAG